MAPLAEQLLPLGGKSSSLAVRSSLQRVAAATAALSAGLLSATVLFFAGAEFGRTTPHTSAAQTTSLTALNTTQTGAVTNLNLGLNADCYKYTGGTCFVDPCDPDRKATCEDGLCVCQGSCTGVDGSCYPTHYPIVATGFTLTNKKYNWQHMYMPSTAPLDQIKTSSFSSAFMFGKDKWILHKLPGKLVAKTDYFLTTEAYPEYVATLRATTGTAFSLFGAYEVGLYKEFSPDRLAVQVCSKGDREVMIGSTGKIATEWFYLHHFSWVVYGTNSGEPGDGAIWIMDPPLPDGVLPVCE